jgi:hypothetical protein
VSTRAETRNTFSIGDGRVPVSPTGRFSALIPARQETGPPDDTDVVTTCTDQKPPRSPPKFSLAPCPFTAVLF